MATDFDLIISEEAARCAMERAGLHDLDAYERGDADFVAVGRPGNMPPQFSYSVAIVALGTWLNVCSNGQFGILDCEYHRVDIPAYRDSASDEAYRAAVADAVVATVREQITRCAALRSDAERVASSTTSAQRGC